MTASCRARSCVARSGYSHFYYSVVLETLRIRIGSERQFFSLTFFSRFRGFGDVLWAQSLFRFPGSLRTTCYHCFSIREREGQCVRLEVLGGISLRIYSIFCAGRTAALPASPVGSCPLRTVQGVFIFRRGEQVHECSRSRR